MPSSKMPEGFPLEPIDSAGTLLKNGDTVKILHVPDWLVNDLGDESKVIIISSKGTYQTIIEFDEYGYSLVEIVSSKIDDTYVSN